MGIHTGEPRPAETGLVGLDVHRAARIGGGRPWRADPRLADDARSRRRAISPGSVDFVDLGEHRLKDMPGPERLFQVAAAACAAEFPALRTADAVRGNLPRQLTTFVGREREVAAGRRLLDARPAADPDRARRGRQDPPRRAQAGDRAARRGSTTAPGSSSSAAADRTQRSSTDARHRARRRRAARPAARSASIVDHLREPAPAARARQLRAPARRLRRRWPTPSSRACPTSRILATSREPLRHRRRGGPAGAVAASLPTDPGMPTATACSRCEAVRLFVERARAVQPGFELTAANARRGRPDLPAAGRHPAGHRARRGPRCGRSRPSRSRPAWTTGSGC